MSETPKNEAETAIASSGQTSTPTPSSVDGNINANASGIVHGVPASPMAAQMSATQFVFQQQIMASPQQQQQPNGGSVTPSPSAGTQCSGSSTSSPMAAMNAMAINQNTINMNAMNTMAMANNMNAVGGMGNMTMSNMNGVAASGFQQPMSLAQSAQTLGHPGMSATPMPQVQVIQQPYLQQLYNGPGQPQFIMPGNIALQSTGVNPTIQVITAGKPFQPGQLTSHVLTTGKNVLQGQADNAFVAQFINARNAGYTTIPTSNNQTLLIGPLISNTQAGVIPSQPGQAGKPADMSKQTQQHQQSFFQLVNSVPPKSPVMSTGNPKATMGTGTVNVTTSQAGSLSQPQIISSQASTAMLGGQAQIISPLQCLPMTQQFSSIPQSIAWATHGGLPQPTLLAQNPIFIRGPQSEGMIFQAPPQQAVPTHATIATAQPGANQAVKPRTETGTTNLQPKTNASRPLTILPSSSGSATTPTPIRPASSVSTQTTGSGTLAHVPMSNPRPVGKARKVGAGRPSQTGVNRNDGLNQNQQRPQVPVSMIQTQQPLLQPVQQTQQLHSVPPQIIAQQFQIPSQLQVQQYQTHPIQQQTVMPVQAFQQVPQQTLDMGQQVQLQQTMNEQQHQFQQSKTVLASTSPVTSTTSVATPCSTVTVQQQNIATSQSTQQILSPSLQSTSQVMNSPVSQTPQQPQSQTVSVQQVVMQQPTLMLQSTSAPYSAVTTTTQTVRSCYKPIAPAPPQQMLPGSQVPTAPTPTLVTVGHQTIPQSLPMNHGEKQDSQQILAIPVGSAVYPIGVGGTTIPNGGVPSTPQNIVSGMQTNLQAYNQVQSMAQQQQNLIGTMGNIQGPVSVSSSGSIPSAGVQPIHGINTNLGGGMITMSTAPLSAMANMTNTVQPTPGMNLLSNSLPSPVPSSVSNVSGLPSSQPVTVAIPPSPSPCSAAQVLISPNRTPLLSTAGDLEVTKSEEMKNNLEVKPPNGSETEVVEPANNTNETTLGKREFPSNNTGPAYQEGVSPAIRERKDPSPPRAVVRPQILTHVLGDFVIQESSEPFPVGRFHSNETLTRNGTHRNGSISKPDLEPPKKKLHMEQPTISPSQQPAPNGKITCEGCGKIDLPTKFRRNKRFCSTACAKRATIAQTAESNNTTNQTTAFTQPLPSPGGARTPTPAPTTQTLATNGIQPAHAGGTNPSPLVVSVSDPCNQTKLSLPLSSSFISGDKEDSNLDAELLALAAQQMRSPTASLSQTPTQLLKPEKSNPAKWTVTEVVDFIKSIHGCSDYAEDFALQEIDGQALMLLKADHLMTAMSMKLGPALKICAKIDSMRGVPSSDSNVCTGPSNRSTP